MQHVLDNNREIFLHQITKKLFPLIYQGIDSIFQEANKISKNDSKNILKNFQTFLKKIPAWSKAIIDHERKRIMLKVEEPEILELLMKTYVKLSLIQLTGVNKISLIKFEDIEELNMNNILHNIYIDVARELYTHPFLMYDKIAPIECKKNQNIVLEIIKTSIKDSLINILPWEEITQRLLLLPDIDFIKPLEDSPKKIIIEKEIDGFTNNNMLLNTQPSQNYKPLFANIDDDPLGLNNIQQEQQQQQQEQQEQQGGGEDDDKEIDRLIKSKMLNNTSDISNDRDNEILNIINKATKNSEMKDMKDMKGGTLNQQQFLQQSQPHIQQQLYNFQQQQNNQGNLNQQHNNQRNLNQQQGNNPFYQGNINQYPMYQNQYSMYQGHIQPNQQQPIQQPIQQIEETKKDDVKDISEKVIKLGKSNKKNNEDINTSIDNMDNLNDNESVTSLMSNKDDKYKGYADVFTNKDINTEEKTKQLTKNNFFPSH